MIRYVPFEDLTQEHLDAIAASLLAAPEWHRPEPADILRSLREEVMRAFFVADSFVIVSVQSTEHEKRLRIESFSGKAFKRRALADFLRRLAADWECDAIETFVFDPRLACAIERIGGRVEAWTLRLDLKD